MADEPAEDGQGTGQVSADEWPTNRPRMAKEPAEDGRRMADEPAEGLADEPAKYRPTNGRRMADEPAEGLAKEPADEPAEAACVLWCHCIVKL